MAGSVPADPCLPVPEAAILALKATADPDDRQHSTTIVSDTVAVVDRAGVRDVVEGDVTIGRAVETALEAT